MIHHEQLTFANEWINRQKNKLCTVQLQDTLLKLFQENEENINNKIKIFISV